jgi:hypothetical protein
VTVVGYDVDRLCTWRSWSFQGQNPVGVEFKGKHRAIHPRAATYKFRTAKGSQRPPTPHRSSSHLRMVRSSPSMRQGDGDLRAWTGQEVLTDDLHAFLRLNNAASVERRPAGAGG